MKNIFINLFGKKKKKVTLTAAFPCDTVLPSGRVYPVETLEDAIKDYKRHKGSYNKVMQSDWFDSLVKYYSTWMGLELKLPSPTVGTIEHPVDQDALMSLVGQIAGKTIGADIVQTKPMTDEEVHEWDGKLAEARKKWEEEHPEEAAEQKEFDQWLNSKESYVLKDFERERIKEIMNIDDEKLNEYETYIYADGQIALRTSQRSWCALAGREWAVNIKTGEYHCVAMS